MWGEGRNDGWHATIDGRDLGRATRLVGGGNAWRLEPSATARVVLVRWRPQRWVDACLAVSVLGALALVALAAWPRRRVLDHDELAPAPARVHESAGALAATLLAVALGAVAHPAYGVGLLAVWWYWRRRPRSAVAVGAFGPAIVATIGAYVALRQIVSRPVAGYGWPEALSAAHRPALAAVALVALHACGRGDEGIGRRHGEQRHDRQMEARIAEEGPHRDE